MRRIFWSAQHGCTFFVAAEGDMLRLDDVLLQDAESGEFSRPDVSGELPREPALYQQVQSCAQCASDGSQPCGNPSPACQIGSLEHVRC